MSATDQPSTVSATLAQTSTMMVAPTDAVPVDQPGSAEPNPELSELMGALAVAHGVAVLAETDPGAPLVVALRTALEVADARHAARRERRVAGWEVHGGDSAWWARWANQWMPYTELAALRATPGTTAHNREPGDQAGTAVDIDGGAR